MICGMACADGRKSRSVQKQTAVMTLFARFAHGCADGFFQENAFALSLFLVSGMQFFRRRNFFVDGNTTKCPSLQSLLWVGERGAFVLCVSMWRL